MFETPREILERVSTGYHYSVYVFTDRIADRNGVKLAKYIKDNDLGEIVEGAKTRNNNSGAVIRAWVWSCKHKKLRAFLKR